MQEVKFADYIVDHYIDYGCDFAPELWAASPQQSPTKTNATESIHSHLNADIKPPHPNMYVSVLQSLTRHLPLPIHIDWFTGIHVRSTTYQSLIGTTL